jgi:hypothetical protein
MFLAALTVGSLAKLILFLLVLGFTGWVIQIMEIEEKIRKLIVGIVVFFGVAAVLLYVLSIFGYGPGF